MWNGVRLSQTIEVRFPEKCVKTHLQMVIFKFEV